MKSRLVILLLGCALVTPLTAQQPGLSARESLGLIASQFGPQSTQWLAEMRGHAGIPQPREWHVQSFDERAPRLLYNFRASGGSASDVGVDEQRYPENIPFGYFSPNQIGLDSVAAFTIAEGEARKAKMSFDSCDYLLRVREFSIEPIWSLQLLDPAQRIVGKIYISANSGQVLRTVWVYRDQRARRDGRPLIIDSAAPTQAKTFTGITDTDYPPTPPQPGQMTGIASVPPGAPPVPGQAGITGAPPLPAPQTPRMVPSDPQPYQPQPFDATGRPISPPPVSPTMPATPRPPVDDGIPEPPAITRTPTAPTQPSMPDIRDVPAAKRPDPTKPPIDVPTTGGGSSERIPPPPIPR